MHYLHEYNGCTRVPSSIYIQLMFRTQGKLRLLMLVVALFTIIRFLKERELIHRFVLVGDKTRLKFKPKKEKLLLMERKSSLSLLPTPSQFLMVWSYVSQLVDAVAVVSSIESDGPLGYCFTPFCLFLVTNTHKLPLSQVS